MKSFKRLLIPLSLILAIPETVLATELAYRGGYGSGRFVCYDSRETRRDHRGSFVLYSGCFKSRSSCVNQGAYHFGKYASSSAQRRAMNRCLNSTPRFVD